MAKVSVVKYGL
jgi:hypothetical protein